MISLFKRFEIHLIGDYGFSCKVFDCSVAQLLRVIQTFIWGFGLSQWPL